MKTNQWGTSIRGPWERILNAFGTTSARQDEELDRMAAERNAQFWKRGVVVRCEFCLAFLGIFHAYGDLEQERRANGWAATGSAIGDVACPRCTEKLLSDRIAEATRRERRRLHLPDRPE